MGEMIRSRVFPWEKIIQIVTRLRFLGGFRLDQFGLDLIPRFQSFESGNSPASLVPSRWLDWRLAGEYPSCLLPSIVSWVAVLSVTRYALKISLLEEFCGT